MMMTRAAQSLLAAWLLISVSPVAAQESRFVDVRVNDLVADPCRDTIWVSVPSSAGAPYGNHLVPIDPSSGAIGTPVFAGSEPDLLAIADDCSTIWLALDGTNRVVPFDVAERTMGEPFEIGAASWRVEDIEAVPGRADAIVVSRNPGPGGSRNVGLAVFVDGTALPTTAGGPINAIAFSESADALYGHNSGISPHNDFKTISIDLNPDGGVSVVTSTGNVFGVFQDRIKFSGGRVYGDRGDVIDPARHAPVGRFGGLPFGTHAFVPDAASNRVFFAFGSVVRAYDATTFLVAGEIEVPGARPARTVIRWGGRGLAFPDGEGLRILVNDLVAGDRPLLRRGDANGDDRFDLSDAVRVLEFLFQGGVELTCPDAGDTDDDGRLLVTDAVFALEFLFQGGPPPPPPAFPACGPDPTADDLGCDRRACP